MPLRASFLKIARQTHLYLGAFTAPAILFFAFTGALQTFSLHESSKDGSHKPAHWILVFAQIHKKQSDQLPPPKIQRPVPASQADARVKTEKLVDPASAAPAAGRSTLPLKIFFIVVSVGLFTSTISGLYISYKYGRNKLIVSLLLLAGIVVPLLAMRL